MYNKYLKVYEDEYFSTVDINKSIHRFRNLLSTLWSKFLSFFLAASRDEASRNKEVRVTHATHFLSYKKQCYEVKFIDSRIPHLQPGFVEEYLELPLIYENNEFEYWRFARKYGTHYYSRYSRKGCYLITESMNLAQTHK